MGTGASKGTGDGSHGGEEEREESLDQPGGQLYLSLKMENYKRKGDIIPHVYGSVPLVGSWDSSKAVINLLSISLSITLFLFVFSRLFCIGF
jgi:6-phosphofructo-2-kinase/fructose-2,6-biphosphatase